MLVDERPVLGGQFYKQPISELDLPASRLADAQFSGGRHSSPAPEPLKCTS